jgi:hypothetical protein
MGGTGSGAYGRRGPKVRKWTVGECYHLDIQTFRGYLNGQLFRLSWDHGGRSANVQTNHDHIILTYSVDSEMVTTRIDIEFTKVGYGERPWFNCPACSKKTSKLYIVEELYSCRICHNLTYLTCQESGDPLDYLSLKIRRLQRRLGYDGRDIHELPWLKPRHMHWETFSRLHTLLELLQMARIKAWMKHDPFK